MDRSFHPRGHVGIKINDQIGQNFQILKDLRQGDPLSPILFNIVIDMLAILINRAKNGGHVTGIVPHLVDGGLSILQYADDTILFMDHYIEKAINMKMFFFVLDKLKSWNYNTCNYLVFNLGSILLDILTFQCTFESSMQTDGSSRRSLRKKLSSLKGKHMSVGGRLVLINSV